jgi:hypothetical protein
MRRHPPHHLSPARAITRQGQIPKRALAAPSHHSNAPIKPESQSILRDGFPGGLRTDIEEYLAGLKLIRRNKAGQRIHVNAFVRELQARVRSVTVWNSVYKLRRAAQLIAPDADFGWLTEIEKDVALVMVPRSKADRLVLTERLVEAGLTLIREAEMFGKTPLARAIGVCNGLLIALLALHPIRVKNFTALTIADTFINIDGRWWLHIPSEDTKSHRADERQVPEFITDAVNRYVKTHRAVLCRDDAEHAALWLSSTTGRQLGDRGGGSERRYSLSDPDLLDIDQGRQGAGSGTWQANGCIKPRCCGGVRSRRTPVRCCTAAPRLVCACNCANRPRCPVEPRPPECACDAETLRSCQRRGEPRRVLD